MRIQILVTMITSKGTYYKGQVADVPPEIAKQWVSKGRALSLEPVKAVKAEAPQESGKHGRSKKK